MLEGLEGALQVGLVRLLGCPTLRRRAKWPCFS